MCGQGAYWVSLTACNQSIKLMLGGGWMILEVFGPAVKSFVTHKQHLISYYD